MNSINFTDKIETTKIVTTEMDKKRIETKEILCDGYFYDVTNFIDRHPGGKIIKYYTQSGEDATHAIQQFHQRSKERVRMMLKALKRRPASDSELGLDDKTLKKNRALTEDFTKLYIELENEGFFEPSYVHNILRLIEVIVMVAVGYALIQCQSITVKVIGSILVGLAQGRSGWMQHESGHLSLSGNPKLDRIFHALLFGKPFEGPIVELKLDKYRKLKTLYFILCMLTGLGLGLSSSWWSNQHSRHHAMPQRLHHDVDLNTMPLLAYNAKVVKRSKDGKEFWIQYQAYLFVLVDTLLVGLLWCLYIHPKYVVKNKLYLQFFAMLGHWHLVSYLGFWPGLLSSWVLSVYLFLNFTLSHTHLPVTTEPTHWVEYSLLHTTDIEQRPWCDWWMGYLNYQVEHHLFPTMPQFRTAQITDRVKALAMKHNIPYYVYSYREALSKTFQNMSDVSHELKKL